MLLTSLLYISVSFLQDAALWMILPNVFFQALGRAQFVKYYIHVESTILKVSEKEEEEDYALALNDWSSGLAAGIGFGFMHALLLCGTLIASEAGDDIGVLYQDSCPDVPSILNTAAMAMLFSILDIILMFFYFYGVRRKLQTTRMGDADEWQSKFSSPNFVICTAMTSHAAAGIASLFNAISSGCYIALPMISIIIFVTCLYFVKYIMPVYLPAIQKSQIHRQAHLS